MGEKSSLFINFKKSLLDEFLICKICNGYFRFAHTAIDCGHTFCRMCIYSHLKKSKSSKCPVCGEIIESNYAKSLKKDPHKQEFVDIIYPEYHEQDNLIAKRCRILFPDIDIQSIKDEYEYPTMSIYPYKKRKLSLENKLKKNLQEIVATQLGTTLDQFSKDLCDDVKFQELTKKKINYDQNITHHHNNPQTANTHSHIGSESSKNTIPSTNQNQIQGTATQQTTTTATAGTATVGGTATATTGTTAGTTQNQNTTTTTTTTTATATTTATTATAQSSHSKEETKQSSGGSSSHSEETSDFYFTIYPKNEKDFQIVGLKNAIKASKTKPLDVFQLKKFLLQHIQEKFKDKETDFFDKSQVVLDKIILSVKEGTLDDKQTLEDLKEKNGNGASFIVYYEVLFKK